MLLRVVIDTNVYYSGLNYRGGVPAKILRAAATKKFQALTSPSIIDELCAVLRSTRRWQEQDITRAIRSITRYCEIMILSDVEMATEVRDTDDNHIVLCGVAGKADLIVTGDKDLYTYKQFEGIGVSRPADFARTLNL